MSTFVDKALAIVTQNKDLDEIEFEVMRSKILDLAAYINLDDEIDENEEEILLEKVKAATITSGTNAGMYVATVITGYIVQSKLDAIHSFGSSGSSGVAINFSNNDFIDFSRGSENVYIKTKLNPLITPSMIPMVGKNLVAVYMKHIIEFKKHNPIDARSIETKKVHRYEIVLDLEKMKLLDLDLKEVDMAIYDFIARRTKGSMEIEIYDTDVEHIYKFHYDLYLKKKPRFEIEKEIDNILVRGNKVITDMFVQYSNDTYDVIFKTYIKSGSEKKYWLKSKALKILTNHPFVEEIEEINHGLVYDNFYGVIHTYYKFLDLQSKSRKKYKDLYVKILILLQTINGSITSIKMASSNFMDSITESTKGKALTKLANSIEKEMTFNELSNFTYLFIFGELKQPTKFSDEMKKIEAKIFGNTELREREMDLRTKLYVEYSYPDL